MGQKNNGNSTPSIEIKTGIVNKTTVDNLNKTRGESGASTIAVVTTKRFTKTAREMLEKQGTSCITLSEDDIKNFAESRKSGGK